MLTKIQQFFKNLKNVNLLRQFNLGRFQQQALILIGLGVFIVANLLLSSVSLRLDLSQGQAYTLTPATKKILNNLDDIVNIKFFVSSDLPTRLQPIKTEVVDLLREYDKNGKVQTQVLDPKRDPKVAQQAQEAGIPEIQFSQLEQDKYAVTAARFGIAITYGGKTEVIPQATDPQSLEYNLTSAIYKLTRKDLPQIGIMSGADPSSGQQDPIGSLRQVLSQQFTVNDLTIATGAAETIDKANQSVLVFDTPTKEFSEMEIKALSNYLKNKGTAMFFVNGEEVQENLQTAPAQAEMINLLDSYGIKPNNDLVLSTTAELVNFGDSVQSFLTMYPFWIRTNVVNEKSGYFSNINQLTYPWVSSLSLTKKSGVETRELVHSTPQSWEQKGQFVLDPQSIPEPQRKDLKSFLVTAQSMKKNEGKVVVVGSSRFVEDRFLGRNSGNVEFVLNVMNDLASGGALAGIRQRAVSIYPIPEMTEAGKDAFKYGNILLLPVLFAIFGTIRLMRRK